MNNYNEITPIKTSKLSSEKYISEKTVQDDPNAINHISKLYLNKIENVLNESQKSLNNYKGKNKNSGLILKKNKNFSKIYKADNIIETNDDQLGTKTYLELPLQISLKKAKKFRFSSPKIKNILPDNKDDKKKKLFSHNKVHMKDYPPSIAEVPNESEELSEHSSQNKSENDLNCSDSIDDFLTGYISCSRNIPTNKGVQTGPFSDGNLTKEMLKDNSYKLMQKEYLKCYHKAKSKNLISKTIIFNSNDSNSQKDIPKQI